MEVERLIPRRKCSTLLRESRKTSKLLELGTLEGVYLLVYQTDKAQCARHKESVRAMEKHNPFKGLQVWHSWLVGL